MSTSSTRSTTHPTMKETTDNHSYYPSAHRMVASTDNETVGGGLKKPRMELTVAHDQWMETSVVMNATQQTQQPEQQQQQQQQQPSVRCTVCKDSDGTPVLYRPSMALHTLFQPPDQDDPSPATRYSKRLTTDGTALHKVDSNQKTSNRLSYLSMYDMKESGTNDNSSRIGNDDENGSSNDNDDDDDDDGLYQRLVIPKQRQSYVTLYDATNHQPIWSLIEQDWHTMTLISRQPPQKYTMMTTSTFSFVWEDQPINGPTCFLFPYQWQMNLAQDGTMELLCEQCQPDRTKLPIALLSNQATRLVLFGSDDNVIPVITTVDENATTLDDDGASKNPFRSIQDNHRRQRKLDSLDTFLILSSLLLYDLITSQLRALGGGTEAMVMMIDRQQQALKEEVDMIYKQYEQKTPPLNPQYYHGMTAEDDMDDMTGEVVMDHHSGNNAQQTRWSSNGSMKSLELDPGFWRCCFGYGCWWHWFPCCMPGGWCDRAWIKARGIRRQQQHHHHHRSRVTRRMQGWQQQEE